MDNRFETMSSAGDSHNTDDQIKEKTHQEAASLHQINACKAKSCDLYNCLSSVSLPSFYSTAGGVPQMRILRTSLMEAQGQQRFLVSNPVVGQNIALHATSADRASTCDDFEWQWLIDVVQIRNIHSKLSERDAATSGISLVATCFTAWQIAIQQRRNNR